MNTRRMDIPATYTILTVYDNSECRKEKQE